MRVRLGRRLPPPGRTRSRDSGSAWESEPAWAVKPAPGGVGGSGLIGGRRRGLRRGWRDLLSGGDDPRRGRGVCAAVAQLLDRGRAPARDRCGRGRHRGDLPSSSELRGVMGALGHRCGAVLNGPEQRLERAAQLPTATGDQHRGRHQHGHARRDRSVLAQSCPAAEAALQMGAQSGQVVGGGLAVRQRGEVGASRSHSAPDSMPATRSRNARRPSARHRLTLV